MNELTKEKAILTVKEILKHLVDFSVISYSQIHKSPSARKAVSDYWRWREFDKSRFSKTIYQLEQRGFIKTYAEGKERYLELTPKGLERARKYSMEDLKIKIPKKWDGKWRIIIFDIPDDKKTEREIFREKLKQLGFRCLQESVFVFPFDCKGEMDLICSNYFIKPYVKYIVADFFEDDDQLIKQFLDEDILNLNMDSFKSSWSKKRVNRN